MSKSAHSADHRIGGLDTLRFICALSVMLCHLGGPPVLAWLDKSHGLGKAAHGLYGSLFPGAPAVIVFFLMAYSAWLRFELAWRRVHSSPAWLDVNRAAMKDVCEAARRSSHFRSWDQVAAHFATGLRERWSHFA